MDEYEEDDFDGNNLRMARQNQQLMEKMDQIQGSLSMMVDRVDGIEEQLENQISPEMLREIEEEDRRMYFQRESIPEEEQIVHYPEKETCFLAIRDRSYKPNSSNRGVFYNIPDYSIEVTVNEDGTYDEISPEDFFKRYTEIIMDFGGRIYYVRRCSDKVKLFNIDCTQYEDEHPPRNPLIEEKMKTYLYQNPKIPYVIKEGEWVHKSELVEEKSKKEIRIEPPPDIVTKEDLMEMLAEERKQNEARMMKAELERTRAELERARSIPPRQETTFSDIASAVAQLKPDPPAPPPPAPDYANIIATLAGIFKPPEVKESKSDKIVEDLVSSVIKDRLTEKPVKNPEPDFHTEISRFASTAELLGFTKSQGENVDRTLALAKEVRLGLGQLGQTIIGGLMGGGMSDIDDEDFELIENALEKETNPMIETSNETGIMRIRNMNLSLDQENELCTGLLSELKGFLPVMKDQMSQLQMLDVAKLKALKPVINMKLKKKVKPGMPEYQTLKNIFGVLKEQVVGNIAGLIDNYIYSVERLAPQQTNVIKELKKLQALAQSQKGKDMLEYLHGILNRYFQGIEKDTDRHTGEKEEVAPEPRGPVAEQNDEFGDLAAMSLW